MTKVYHISTVVLTFFILAATASLATLSFFPFYVMEQPIAVLNKESVLSPGGHVQIQFVRHSRISAEATLTRELIRADHSGVKYELERVQEPINIEKGTQTIRKKYQLPADKSICNGGRYKYTGTITYPVGWVKRPVPFSTELFDIECKGEK